MSHAPFCCAAYGRNCDGHPHAARDPAGGELFLSYGDGFWTFQNDRFRAIKRDKQIEAKLEQVFDHFASPYRITVSLGQVNENTCLTGTFMNMSRKVVIFHVCTCHLSCLPCSLFAGSVVFVIAKVWPILCILCTVLGLKESRGVQKLRAFGPFTPDSQAGSWLQKVGGWCGCSLFSADMTRSPVQLFLQQ